MGKTWDGSKIAYDVELWREALRVLKPGGHLLAFGGTRTWHRLAVAVEDAGFEIRDSIAWMYGSGFPKSHDVSKGIDKAAGAEREITGTRQPFGREGRTKYTAGTGVDYGDFGASLGGVPVTTPATPAAQQWQGWGTALKPAFEPVVMARKPFKGTVAANVQQWGTGALNIDATRIGLNGESQPSGSGTASPEAVLELGRKGNGGNVTPAAGRWPANVVLDEHAAEMLDQQSGIGKAHTTIIRPNDGTFLLGSPKKGSGDVGGYADQGGASRFFKVAESDAPFMYVAKAPKKERPVVDGVAHATVKPLALMRWLVRLVTPPGGTVLEPFAGSGTTVEACMLEGFHCIAIEREAEYLPLIQARIDRQAA